MKDGTRCSRRRSTIPPYGIEISARFHLALAVLFSFGFPAVTPAQGTTTFPLKIETTFGWNQFTHSGINDDMRVIRDSTQYSDYSIPIGKFGKDYNFRLMVSTVLTNEISAGLSVQYYGTRGYYGFNGTTISPQTVTEVEYALSRIAPQVTAEYSHPMQWSVPFTVSVRVLIGAAFVDLRKDYNFAYAPQSPNPPFPFLPPFGLHVIGQYEVINPELGLQLSLGIGILDNIRFKTSGGWVFSPSKEVSGSFSSLAIEEIRSNESFKNVLLRNVNLGYSGITFGGGFEFGL